MAESVLMNKCFEFAIYIVNLYKKLSEEKKEFVMSKQLLRSGTAVGALISEGQHAESKLDFVHRYAIAQKECNESIYWIKLLFHTNYITREDYEETTGKAIELIRIITASIKTAKKNVNNG